MFGSYHGTQKGVVVKIYEDPIVATCPFCGEVAEAKRPTDASGKEVDGLVYAIRECQHSHGIMAGGRWDEGCFLFEGSLPPGIAWTSADYETDPNGLLHAVNILREMKGWGLYPRTKSRVN